MIKDKTYFHNLDSLRTIAALVVILAHCKFQVIFVALEEFFGLKLDFLRYLISGESAVAFFFVLSGFLITYFLIAEWDTEKKINLKNFYLKRVLRIWPLYYFVCAFGFLIYPVFKDILFNIDTTLSSSPTMFLFFLSNLDFIDVVDKGLVDHVPMMLGVTWSVSIEEQFYLFWPLIFVFVRKEKHLVIAMILVLIGSLVYRIMVIDDNTRSYFHTISSFFPLAIGGLGACVLKFKSKILQLFNSQSKYLNLFLYVFPLVILLIAHHYTHNALLRFFARIFESIFFLFIVIDQSVNKKVAIALGNISFLKKLGKYTYGIYLLHPIALQVLELVYRYLNISPYTSWKQNLMFTFSTGILSIIIAYMSYTFFESYFLKIKDRLTVKKST